MSDLHENDTDEFPPRTAAAKVGSGTSMSAHVEVEVAGMSHVGRVRPNNEDHYLVIRFGRSMHTLLSNLPPGFVPDQAEETGIGMAVADGMGGIAAGEVASRMALSTLVNLCLTTPDWFLRLGDREIEIVMERMADRFRRIADVLAEQGRRDPTLEGMGTTMTLACSVGPQLILVHVGDSRVYLFRRGKLIQLTHDHTVAQGLADEGLIAREEVATHRQRHVLTRSLGAAGRPVEAEVQKIDLTSGDQVLLTSDGVTDMVDDKAIATLLGGNGSVKETCQALIDRALRNGGKDNTTAVLARYYTA
jgi:PPM family protein phosphatase